MLSMTTQIERIAVLLEGIEGAPNVYRPSTNGKFRVPEAVVPLPAVICLPDATIEYILSSGMQRHTYRVKLSIFHRGGDAGFAAANVLPFVDRVIAKFERNVTLGERATYCVFQEQSGLGDLDWGGIAFPGLNIWLKVSEEGTAAPAPGEV